MLAETLIGGVGALAVLLFVFASFLALLPLVIAGIAILTTFLVVLGLTYLTDISFIVEFLVALVGLGVAIDYSLLIVTRWREERTRGISNHQAVENAMVTAGRAVVFSGLTVAIGLLALVVIPVPFLRSIGVGGMLIPVVSVAVATTLLPAFLSTIGPRVDWPHIRHENTASRFWLRWGTRRRASPLDRHRRRGGHPRRAVHPLPEPVGRHRQGRTRWPRQARRMTAGTRCRRAASQPGR